MTLSFIMEINNSKIYNKHMKIRFLSLIECVNSFDECAANRYFRL